jgi:nucleoside-diphosphate-sugar epimerase
MERREAEQHKEVTVEILPGDVSLLHLGLDEATYSRLAGRITHIIHTAADLRLGAPLEELRKTNLQGTANMLELARLAQRDHGLERYAHVSTAYVAGGRSGAIPEADLTGEYGFSCTYELSKFEGECLVQAAKSELPVSVFRPGMIVGASTPARSELFNTFYFPLRLYLTEAASSRRTRLCLQHHPSELRGRSGRTPDLLPGGERVELPPDRADRVAAPGGRAGGIRAGLGARAPRAAPAPTGIRPAAAAQEAVPA